MHQNAHTKKVDTLTSSILMAKVWEPPHVPQAHTEPHLGQHILDLRVPRWSVCITCLISICTVHSCELSFRLALAQPGSVLVAVQWRFLRLDINKEEY